jgi:HK97 family phage major capsid protein
METPVTIEEWRAHEAELRQRTTELDTEYAGQKMPDTARAEWDETNAQIEAARETIAELEVRAARLADLSERDENAGRIGEGLQVARPGAIRSEDIYDLGEYRRRAHDEDHQRELMVDGARRAVEQIGAINPKADLAKAEELLRATPNRDPEVVARRMLKYGNPVYERVFSKALSGKPLTTEEQRAFTVGSTGTYPVPIALDPTVVHTSNWSVNPWRQISNVESITGTQWKGVTSGAITAAYTTEGTEASDNTPTLAQPAITPVRAQAFVPFSIETDQDWGGVQTEMARLLSEAKDDLEATKFWTGTGSNEPKGLGSSQAAVTTVTTASGGAFVIGDVYKLFEQVPPRFRPGATFVSSLFGIDKVRQFDTAGGAGMLVRLPFGASGQPGSQQASSGVEIVGRPLYESTAINTTNVLTTGTNIFVCGNFSYFKIIDRVGMDIELIPHLFGGSNRYPTGQRGLYAMWRNSSDVLSASAFRILQT